MALKHVVALAGGVGGAKLALGLSRQLSPDQLTIIVNTGDDFSLYGMAISPDLDTMMYTLSGVVNPQFGWGLDGDTLGMLDMLSRYGETPWFRLGDRDLATHLLRTQWLAAGCALTEVTRRLCARLGIANQILPMTDAPVRTILHTVEYGTLPFQEYFVKYHWEPTVRQIDYQGAAHAALTASVQNALAQADLVVMCPSNPLLSIAPMLAVPGMRDALVDKRCVAVSPIVGGAALKGPAAKLMQELGQEVSALAVAAYYGDLLQGFVLDNQDAALYTGSEIACAVLVTNTVMQSEQDKRRLAQEVLDWAEDLTP